ncbi:hypothetical protein [Burkholderia territorii]|uniref:hypothetical protein n=1 Tax=Burkholderia territorii TaxID=1503055 RepID=UPI000AE7C36B|nr:hypothetical protein [Burkholderia territorii]
MTTDQSIFGNEANKSTQTPNGGNAADPHSQNQPDYTTLLSAIRNEAGEQKYKTLEDALNALKHSQEYIPQLKQQLTEREQELQRVSGEKRSQEEIERTVQELARKLNEQTDNKPNGLSQEQIAELVNRTLSQNKTKEQAEANQQAVVQELTKQFGEKAKEKYFEAAADMGLSIEEMDALAAKSPKAVLKALGITGQQQKQTSAPMGSSVNSAAFQPHQDSYVKRNDNRLEVGATFAEVTLERQRSNKMVEELHANGMSVHDLTNPKTYKQYFG